MWHYLTSQESKKEKKLLKFVVYNKSFVSGYNGSLKLNFSKNKMLHSFPDKLKGKGCHVKWDRGGLN